MCRERGMNSDLFFVVKGVIIFSSICRRRHIPMPDVLESFGFGMTIILSVLEICRRRLLYLRLH